MDYLRSGPRPATALIRDAALPSNGNFTRCALGCKLHFQNCSLRRTAVTSQVDDGELLVTAPQVQRRTLPLDNSPAVRRLVKTVEPVDTGLHPKPRLWMANSRQRELFSCFPLFFRAVHHPESYLVSTPIEF
ncbi:hypothetical protein [Paraburkholderia phenoliruptrix]|uniref:hypothetical protein n=1 Tax=Paraburkholderia phenoliruptrix TaxID=252970 RepID=UPI001C6F079C|nr:hypothetical protein [Paraburkholderia phenoliruptrix]MBW9108098.1 hypothetical protein [Paraburkholderia phenoliruptrix]MBW9133426.1 hypothetical protein [Paraburkholderia ginsengiterrae]